jgi:hypothetical protein
LDGEEKRSEKSEDEGDDEVSNDDDKAPIEDERVETTYHVAKTPGYGNLSLTALSAQFGATDFLSQLEQFLRWEMIYPQHFHTISVPFAVYKQIALYLPNIREVSDLRDLKDTIHTRRSEPAHGRKKAVSAQFNTALAYKIPIGTRPGRLEGEWATRNRAT